MLVIPKRSRSGVTEASIARVGLLEQQRSERISPSRDERRLARGEEEEEGGGRRGRGGGCRTCRDSEFSPGGNQRAGGMEARRTRSLNEIFVLRPEAPDAIKERFNRSPALLRATWTFRRRRAPSSLRVAAIGRPRLRGWSAIRGAAADTETDGHETSQPAFEFSYL
ncbi:hypothetical protein EYF80_025124 [Liparis tanakae]|uniref:Uncharacterized protein n=1 Tax=Liparis tanakae TaxID=230148 RepID=A0A4Z2HH75_9TELE|nr:hypothetical protein EYF80_025124 [Liparis tanakae]